MPTHDGAHARREAKVVQPLRADALVVDDAVLAHERGARRLGGVAEHVADVVEQRADDDGVVRARVGGAPAALDGVVQLAHRLVLVIAAAVSGKELQHARDRGVRLVNHAVRDSPG